MHHIFRHGFIARRNRGNEEPFCLKFGISVIFLLSTTNMTFINLPIEQKQECWIQNQNDEPRAVSHKSVGEPKTRATSHEPAEVQRESQRHKPSASHEPTESNSDEKQTSQKHEPHEPAGSQRHEPRAGHDPTASHALAASRGVRGTSLNRGSVPRAGL